MLFKDFITRQRAAIFFIGIATFNVSLGVAHVVDFRTLWGSLFIDLAASAVTVIFTALIIDYLSVLEVGNKTKNAAGLAEDEIKATCFRVRWRLARLFGMRRPQVNRDNISKREEAKKYLDMVGEEVTAYLEQHNLISETTPLETDQLPRYLERLQFARSELEQTLMLYEYAMSYSLRERVLGLRSELQIADNIIGFIDVADELNEANLSLIRVLAQSINDAVELVLEHDSRIELGTPLHAKEENRLA